MALSLKPRHLKRYGEIARLLVKYGRGDLVRASGMDGSLVPWEEQPITGRAEHLADDLERLGPTFVKLGQVLSTRTGRLYKGLVLGSRMATEAATFSSMPGASPQLAASSNGTFPPSGEIRPTGLAVTNPSTGSGCARR